MPAARMQTHYRTLPFYCSNKISFNKEFISGLGLLCLLYQCKICSQRVIQSWGGSKPQAHWWSHQSQSFLDLIFCHFSIWNELKLAHHWHKNVVFCRFTSTSTKSSFTSSFLMATWLTSPTGWVTSSTITLPSPVMPLWSESRSSRAPALLVFVFGCSGACIFISSPAEANGRTKKVNRHLVLML